MIFLGARYPIVKNPRGFLSTETGLNVVKGDLLCLLLQNPGDRVMMPTFGTGLDSLVFEPATDALISKAQQLISNAIKTWEPRVVIQGIDITIDPDPRDLNPEDTLTEKPNTMVIKIMFSEFDDISVLQDLVLEIPLAG